ncbi:RNA polymerase sigma factor [Blastococcus capsensis]|uniref:RNA polymerase sigma factor n=1 Tax=Blastococcus capsensis TaxID=1564163 RepID=UPI00254115DC|nr:RNA polymerase sigma factor [Blastococcus capsensis]MDK3255111.1 RNA polymerase sigma factor [Blastococcus capsensis]
MTPTAMRRAAGPPGEPPRLRALPHAPPSDAELIARSVDDPAEFALLFDRHATTVHRYLGRRVGELADDLLSETFLIAFRRPAAYRPEHVQVRPWLLGIATNVVHGHVRTEQRRYRALARAAAESERHGTDPGDSADRLDAQALRGQLAAALAGLEPRDRDALLLLTWGQLGYQAARTALLAEIEGPAPRRSRVPSRKVSLRVGLAAVTAAAAWAAAVVIAAPDGPGTPAESVTLVDFQMPAFPLSLDPEPEGLRPAFDGDGDGARFASYEEPSGRNGFYVSVGDESGEGAEDDAPGYRELASAEVSVDGRDADLVRYSRDWCAGDLGETCERRTFAQLDWERADDQWVRILGHGRYGTADAVIEIGESLVDRPQRATLTAGLAPAGWSLQFFKMGRVLALVNDAYEQQTITVHVPLPEDVPPPGQVRESLMGPVGPQLDVMVQGRPAALVRVDNGPRDRGWFLQGQFEDGTTFTLQVPDAFTQEQVLQFAEQVTYHP